MSAFGMAWGALILSTVVLLLVVLARLRQAKAVGKELARIESGAGVLSLDIDGLMARLSATSTAFAGWQEMLGRVETEQVSWSGDAVKDDFFEANPRIVQFIDLQRAWEKKTGQGLVGPALRDGRVIEKLTEPDSSNMSAEEATLKFTVAARRVVEYMLDVSGTRDAAIDWEQVRKLLESMAELAELELIDPAQGQRMDRDLHHLAGSVPAGAQRAGTIAKVEVRGLMRTNRAVVKKASVHLYH